MVSIWLGFLISQIANKMPCSLRWESEVNRMPECIIVTPELTSLYCCVDAETVIILRTHLSSLVAVRCQVHTWRTSRQIGWVSDEDERPWPHEVRPWVTEVKTYRHHWWASPGIGSTEGLTQSEQTVAKNSQTVAWVFARFTAVHTCLREKSKVSPKP